MRMGSNATNAVLLPEKRPDTHCTEGWADPRASLDGCGKSFPTWIRSPDHPARGKSLHRLRYPGPPYRIEDSAIRKTGTNTRFHTPRISQLIDRKSTGNQD